MPDIPERSLDIEEAAELMNLAAILSVSRSCTFWTT